MEITALGVSPPAPHWAAWEKASLQSLAMESLGGAQRGTLSQAPQKFPQSPWKAPSSQACRTQNWRTKSVNSHFALVYYSKCLWPLTSCKAKSHHKKSPLIGPVKLKKKSQSPLGAGPRGLHAAKYPMMSVFLREKDHMIKYDQGALERVPTIALFKHLSSSQPLMP